MCHLPTPHDSRGEACSHDGPPSLRESLVMTIAETIGRQSKLRASAREFFALRGYAEVQTPTIVRTPDLSPNLSPMEVTVHTRGGAPISAALITSPEYALKKVVAAGVPRVYEFARVFRDGEPVDTWHTHDFTMLEFYRMPCAFEQGIQETIELIVAVARAWHEGEAKALVHGRTVSVESGAWEVITISRAFEQYAGVACPPNPSSQWYKDVLTTIGQTWEETDTIGDLFQRVFFAVVQPALDRAYHPIIISEYPAHEASLAQLNARGYAERFEAYIGGIELCNAYGELTHSHEQRERFLAEQAERARLGKTPFPIDEALCDALHSIHEPLFGNAIGWDRLVAVITGAPSIAHTQVFPLHGHPKPDTFRTI